MEISINSPVTAGALSWPGDNELLKRYGVTPKDIVDKIKQILASFKLNSSLSKQFMVITSNKLQEIAKIHCAYCQTIQEHTSDLKITNKCNGKEIHIPNVMFHFLEEHGDLGDPGEYRVAPTHACKVLELGNTYLPENDPLFLFAKYESWTHNEIRQKHLDDKIINNLDISLFTIYDQIYSLTNNALIQLNEDNRKTYAIVNKRFKVWWNKTYGYQECNLCEPNKRFEYYYMGAIENIKTGKSFPTSTLSLHVLCVHDFFSRNPLHRIDPEIACEVLELSKDKALAQG